MTRGIENTLIAHGGTEDIDIPASALNKLINDALKPDCDDRYEALQRQVEALEEANKRVCDERDFYMSQCHAYEARLAGKVYD
jgi:hypothetical protein